MYKNILVPVDVFEIGLADKALSHAQFLAQSASGQIHLVHVNPLFSPQLTRGFISDARKMEDYLVKNSEEKLAELAKSPVCRKATSIFMSAAAIFVMK